MVSKYSSSAATAVIPTMEDNDRGKKRKLSTEDSETVSNMEQNTTTDERDVKLLGWPEDLCSSNSSLDRVSASTCCCSSTINGSPNKYQEEEKEEEHEEESVEVETSSMCYCFKKRRETMTRTTPSTGFGEEEVIEEDDLDSTTSKPPSTEEEEECSPRGPIMEEKKIIMPTQEELSEFFAEAERELKEEQKKFMEKYNFDIIKEKPMEGRYEWELLSP